MGGLDDTAGRPSEKWRIHNEFASVTLAVVSHGRGTRLRISAGRVESTGLIDATVLEALTLLSEDELAQVVALATDPGNVLQGDASDGPVAGDGRPADLGAGGA